MASTANPFFPGYYVGDPLPKPLKDKRKYGPPNEYKFDIFSEYLDSIGADVSGLPVWVKDRIIGDWKSNLKADIEADTTIPVEVYEQYGEETQQDQPGAFGIDVSLNPVDWFTDPKKQLQKTTSNWWESARDWDDFDVRSKDKLWKSLLSGKPVEGDSAWERAVTGAAVGAMARKTGGNSAADLAVLGKVLVKDKKRKEDYDPISNTSSPTIVEKDAYGDTANAISKFQMSSAAAPSRDKNYDNVIFTSAEALIADIEHSTKKPTGPAQIRQSELFKAKADLAKLMKDTEEHFTGVPGGAPGLSAQLSKYHQEIGNNRIVEVRDEVTHIVTMKKVGDVSKEAAEKKFGEVQKHFWGDPGTGAGGIDDRIKQILGKVNDPDDKKRIEALAKSYRGTVRKLQSQIASGASLPSGRLEARFLRLKLEAIKGTEIAGGDLIQKSAQRRLLKELERDILFDPSGLLNDVSTNGWAMRRYLRRLAEERQYGEVTQFARDLEGGNLMKVYIWPRARRLMEGFTPAYATKNFLAKTHFFGLVIDERTLDEGRSFRIFDTFVKSSPFLHKFNLKIEVNIPLSVNPLKLFATVTGGKQFEFVKTASKLRTGIDITKLDLAGKILQTGDNVLLEESALLYLFSLKGGAFDYAAFKAANLGKDIFSKEDDYIKFYNQFRKFEEWLQANKKLFDSKGAITADDPVFVLALFRALNAYSLNKDTLDIVRKYAGMLEKVWSTLNRAQTWVFKKFGKFIAPLSYLKTLITESLASGITKSLEALLAGTGIGAILIPLLEGFKFILKFIIRKILDFGQALLTAILKMDFSGIYKSISKSYEALVKAALYLSAIPLVIILLMFLLFGVFISSISAFNPTFIQSGTPVYVGGGPGSIILPPPNPNIACPLDGGTVSEGSYDHATGTGHGSNNYWRGKINKCYMIPYIFNAPGTDNCNATTFITNPQASCSPFDSDSVCYNKTPHQTYYGYAADISPTSSKFVYLPSLAAFGNPVTSWTVGDSISISDGSWGYGVTVTSADGTYKMYLGHLDNNSIPPKNTNIVAGGSIGQLYTGWSNQHVHVELTENNVPVKPELWFNCN